MSKFTFKKSPKPTGLSGVAYPYQSVTIKVKGKVCGSIIPPNYHTPGSQWRISLSVKTETSFKNITFKATFNNPELAKDFLKNGYDKITAKYELHFTDE